MAFDIGAGVAEAGKAIADTAGKYTLEAQRANLQQEGIKLADQLAGVREEKQRGFLASESALGRTHTSSENALNRVTQIEAANIGLKGHAMSAGASLQSARIHAESIEKQIAAENDRAIVMQPNADMTVSRINKVTGKTDLVVGADNKPIKVRDPDLAKAQYEAVRAVETDKKEIRLKYQTDLSLAQSELNKTLALPMASMDETLKKTIEQQRKFIDEVTKKRDAELAPHEARSRQLIDSLSRNIDTGGPTAESFYKPPGASKAAAPGAGPTVKKAGLINSPLPSFDIPGMP